MTIDRVRRVFVLGGARSGKSTFAQQLAEDSGLELVFCATAAVSPEDTEMRGRIARHRADRDDRWRTIEAPLDLLPALTHEVRPGRVVLVDCLTLWLSNVMFAERDLDRAIGNLAAAIPVLRGAVIFVSNEVGQGIVPDNALARRFRDAQGRLNQRVAAACDTAVLVAAGLPMVLKPRADPPIHLA